MSAVLRAWPIALLLAAACGSKGSGEASGDDAGPIAAAAPPPKTSKPSKAAIAGLAAVKQPRAFTFFPPGPMADQVFGYLSALGVESGVAIQVRELDRLVHVEEAKRFRITRDGVIVLVSGDASEQIELHVDGPEAEADLASLDPKVARALARLGRGTRQVALVKHQVADIDRTRTILLDQALASLGYAVTNLAPGKEVPAGALAIFLDAGVGPTRPAMETIDRHLAAGGAALVAIEPRAGASLGPLEKRLGLALDDGTLADPQAHAVKQRDARGNYLVLTSAVSVHPSVATLGRMGAGKAALLFASGGALVERGEPPVTRTVTIRSMSTSFLDKNRNRTRDRGEEARAYPIAAAVSGPFRALVVADASWLSDEVVRSVPGCQALLVDAIRWLAGEEVMVEDTAGAPATGDQLTSYPLRTVGTPTSRAALWKVAPDGVHGVRFESRGRVVLLERKDGELWGRLERPTADGAGSVREFPLGPEGRELVVALAAPVPLRTVGPLDATTRARYGLDDGTLTIDLAGGATHKVMIGARVPAGNDRYAADPAARAVVILPASMVDALDQPERLAVRRVIDLDPKALTRLAVTRGDRTREAVREPGGGWKVPDGGSDDAYLVEEIARAAYLLVPLEFARADRANTLTPAGKITLTAGSAPALELEIYSGAGDEFWIATRLTRGLARVSAGSARRIAQAIDQLLPASAE